MPCVKPLDAWKQDSGKITFNDLGSGRHLKLPCGRCISCRWTKTQSWAIRCMHEAQMHKESCFITLTYNDANYTPSLDYTDFQKFIRRTRASIKPKQLRYFMCGEYGETTNRPHFHALIFGHRFGDWSTFKQTLWRSPELEKLWTAGHSTIGEANQTTARYCASYVNKKISGPPAKNHYARVHLATGEIHQVKPEFAKMSLKPAIGKTWFNKYWPEVFGPRDGVVTPGGRTIPAPKYYNELLEQLLEQLEKTQARSGHSGNAFPTNSTASDLRKRLINIDQDRIEQSEKTKNRRTTQQLAIIENDMKARLRKYRRNKL